MQFIVLDCTVRVGLIQIFYFKICIALFLYLFILTCTCKLKRKRRKKWTKKLYMYISNESEYSSTKVIVVLSNTHFKDINKILGFFSLLENNQNKPILH